MEALEAVLRAKTFEQIERLERRVVRSGLSVLRTGNSVHIRIPFLFLLLGYAGIQRSRWLWERKERRLLI